MAPKRARGYRTSARGVGAKRSRRLPVRFRDSADAEEGAETIRTDDGNRPSESASVLDREDHGPQNSNHTPSQDSGLNTAPPVASSSSDEMAQEENWGMLSESQSYGRAGDTKEDFAVVPYKEALSETYSSYQHASHTMILARNDSVLWDLYHSKASILMQLRFDGLLGFPGGLVDPGETPVQGANRELAEEIGLDVTQFCVEDKDHIRSYLHEKKKLMLHFYGLEVKLDDFIAIERKNLCAPDYGAETLGIIRPPLYTMGDGYRGLPAFLSQSFAGNAKEELLCGLEHYKILSGDEVNEAMNSCQQFQEKNSKAVGVTITTT